MTINQDRFPDDLRQVAYASSRLAGVALQFMEPYLDHNSACRVTYLGALFDRLRDRFADPFAQKTARDQFKRLRMNNKDFQVFLGEFQRLAAEGGYPVDEQLEELQEKISDELKTATLGYEPVSLQQFILEVKTYRPTTIITPPLTGKTWESHAIIPEPTDSGVDDGYHYRHSTASFPAVDQTI